MNTFLSLALSLSLLPLAYLPAQNHPQIPPELIPQSIHEMNPGILLPAENYTRESILQFYNQIASQLTESDRWKSIAYSSISEPLTGDLILFGNSENEIQMLVVYLGNEQFMELASDRRVPNQQLLSLNQLKTKKAYPYQVVLRFNTEEALTEEAIAHENPLMKKTPIDSPHEQQIQRNPTEIKQSSLFTLGEVMHCGYINEEQMPLVISLQDPSVPLSSIEEWAVKHRNELGSLLELHGAILLRNFPIQDADHFASILQLIFDRPLKDYLGEGSRKKVAKGVYTSTEAPPYIHIPLHNEYSCTNHPIPFICFYCQIAPLPGSGQTLLGKTQSVHEEILKHPEIWNFFDGHKIKYISRHPSQGSFFTKINKTHKTWQDAFETTDKEEVNRICQEKGFEYRWLGDWIEVTRMIPAIRGPDHFFDHPYWFNQAYLYHSNPRLCGGWVNYVLANLLYIVPTTKQYDVELDDGTPLSKELVYKIYDILNEKSIKFDWKERDVLIVDNIRGLHGRASYTGPRRILTAMIE